jgi:hypothetical protein
VREAITGGSGVLLTIELNHWALNHGPRPRPGAAGSARDTASSACVRRARGPPFLPTPRDGGRTRAAAWPWWARLVIVPCPARPEHPSLPSLCPRPERKTRWAPARNRRKRNAGGTRCLHAATEMEKKPPGTAPARSAPCLLKRAAQWAGLCQIHRSMGRVRVDQKSPAQWKRLQVKMVSTTWWSCLVVSTEQTGKSICSRGLQMALSCIFTGPGSIFPCNSALQMSLYFPGSGRACNAAPATDGGGATYSRRGGLGTPEPGSQRARNRGHGPS